MPERSLAKLDPRIRFKIQDLLAKCKSAGLKVRVIETLRSAEQHKKNMAAGTSWAKRSKHCPRPPLGLSLACDIAVVEYLTLPNWNPEGAKWQVLGALGESCGLEWGGRWKQQDMAHFQV